MQADISSFEQLMNVSDCFECPVHNGIFDKIKSGTAGMVGQAKYNFNRWRKQRSDAALVQRTMGFPTRGVSGTQQDRIADELVSWEPRFLEFVDELYFATNQIDKYAKQWLVVGKRVNMEKLEQLLRDAERAAYKARYVLAGGRSLHEGNR